ncbi:MMPL family transporter, partial [bacterium]|nr:MMPL family transporter [bacterium]
TSLTSAAGFASLALAHIPPVQVFGLFVAFGIMAAWVLTITLIPAYTMFISDKALENFGHASTEASQSAGLSAWLHGLGNVTFQRAKIILAITLAVLVFSIYGISKIQINDNPIKWFSPSHPIRVADRVMNEHLGGTYMAYLALEPGKDASPQSDALKETIRAQLEQLKTNMATELPQIGAAVDATQTMLASIGAAEPDALEAEINKQIEAKMDEAKTDALDAWDEVLAAVEKVFLGQQTFKRPDVLRYIASMQQALIDTGIVGKSNSVTDVVKKIHKELFEGKDEYSRVPDTSAAVAQCLISYQNSHDPDDLWHLVTPDYKKTSLWIQLKSGDNKDMEQVIKAIDQYMIDNPPPVPLQHNWFGLTYINVVWQNKMVSGMLEAFLGSFLIVFLMMTILFSSPLWGILCMIPLTVTIGFIYGMIGFAGKDYDMPVAVLSSLTLGLAVDFAIHFLARARELVKEHGSWQNSIPALFGEPARAIARNLIVIAVGFLPLLAAPLMPYKTVGIFIATILAVSGIGTLIILPALVTVLQKRLFKEATAQGVSCNCSVCIVSSILSVVILAMNLREFIGFDWNALTWFSVIMIPILAMTCGLLSRRRACGVSDNKTNQEQ